MSNKKILQHYQVLNVLLSKNSSLDWQDILVFGAMNIAKDKDTYEVKISQSKLAQILGVDRRKIARHIKHLLDLPAIKLLRKEGRCYVYQMPKNYKHFECFGPDFFKNKDYNFEEKAFLMASQQFYILNNNGTLGTTIGNTEMSNKLRMSMHTLGKITNSLQDKGAMQKVPTQAKDIETGCKKEKYILYPEKYGQAILLILKKHEDDINDLKKENEDLRKVNTQMREELDLVKQELKNIKSKLYKL